MRCCEFLDLMPIVGKTNFKFPTHGEEKVAKNVKQKLKA
jgi:hypothetical protein